MKNNNKGFSLVELIVVIAIMSILAAVAGVAVLRYIEKSRQAMDVYNASLIRDAINTYEFPSNYQGETATFYDSNTHQTETYKRGWVYVDKDEIRCSDASTALAMIKAGLVYVSYETESQIAEHEEEDPGWFPSGKDGDYYRRTGIDEYVFRNNLKVKARSTWNTYQIDVYVDSEGELHLGATASNQNRTDSSGHSRDSETARMFSKKLGLENEMDTPVGNQYNE